MSIVIRRMKLRDFHKIFGFKETEDNNYLIIFVSKKIPFLPRIYNKVNLLLSLIDTRLATKKFVVFGVFNDGKLEGFAYLVVNKSPYEFGIFINKSFRGLGLGKALTKRTLEYAENNDADVFLAVEDCNVNAIKLYRKMGFEEYEKVIFMKKKHKGRGLNGCDG